MKKNILPILLIIAVPVVMVGCSKKSVVTPKQSNVSAATGKNVGTTTTTTTANGTTQSDSEHHCGGSSGSSSHGG